MMSGQVANSFFFIKRKDWRSKTLANPPPPMSDSISFLVYHSPTPPHPPHPLTLHLSKWTSYVYHPLTFLQKILTHLPTWLLQQLLCNTLIQLYFYCDCFKTKNALYLPVFIKNVQYLLTE